ncbi:MAG: hypothetical protein IJH39_11195 [Clostridia bacterium]|nr:hypothetical protein [Clostridia bacterium]
MIALLVVILIMSIVSSGCCLVCWLDIRKKSNMISKSSDAVTELYKEIADLRKDIIELKNNPAEFTKRFSLVDFRLKKMEDILSSFNNGFRYNEAWMR